MFTIGKTAVAALALAGLASSMITTEASAATARHLWAKGHYGSAYRYNHYRHYGNGGAGRVVAGAALGLIGAAAGAAIASNAYDNDGYGYGGGYGYAGNYGYPYGDGYSYGGYGPAPYTYGGYGYGYQPF